MSKTVFWEHDELMVKERDGSIDILDEEGTVLLTMDWIVFQEMVGSLYHQLYMT